MGDRNVAKVMLDLGARINLIPYSIFLRLSLRDLKPITVSFQLLNKSIKYSNRMVEDVLM